MKRILTTAAILLTAGAPAFAQTDMLRGLVEERLDGISPQVEVSTLTDQQVAAIYAEISSEDSTAELRRSVDAIVADDQYRMDPDAMDMARVGGSNDIREVVANMLETEDVQADVSELTDEQVAALYLEMTGGEDTDVNALEAIVN